MLTENNSPVCVITGGSGGIGLAAATATEKLGYRIYELSRRGAESSNITHISCDVTDEAAVDAAFSAVFAAEGEIDLLLLCAGYGISGAAELTNMSDAKKIFDVNFFGVFACVKAAIPYMRKTGGKIICVSSVAAPMAIPYQAFYSCTKAAINDLVLALRIELKRFNISVCAVMPGDAKTGFTASREKAPDPENLYSGADLRAVAVMERDEQNGMTPEAVAKYILRAVRAKNPRPFYIAGFKYRLLVFASRFLPAGLVNAVIGKMYSGSEKNDTSR